MSLGPSPWPLTTWNEGFSQRERALFGWAGLRGAVPVILATFPVIRHVPDSLEFFNIIFFAVLLSAAIQGLTIQTLASKLGISALPFEQVGADR